MKKILLVALKYILLFSLIVIIVSLSFGFVLWMAWPLWVGAFILLGFLGLWLAYVFVKKILLRRREQHFVHQVIQQDEAYLQKIGGHEQEGQRELQARWKEAIDTLRSSHLKKHGNPLYVLPWYLIIGESGSGKTTAIKSAKLSAPFTETSKVSGISGTRNCDWWFFDQAILIDTAGRYAIPLNEEQDRKEWQRFLSLLIKYRKKEPINGLVVTISADKLLNAPAQAIETDALSIRQRIDELMRSLGARFPVYVLITKCDLVQGMTQFCDHLPERCLDQAMGLLNNELSTDPDKVVSRLFESIAARLRELRLLLVQQAQAAMGRQRMAEPELLLFPDEFSSLQANLTVFMRVAFKPNPYQESPILRGVYFSSGRQEGTPFSHFLNALGLIRQQEVLPGTSRGLFLHDLFAKVLPRDKKLFAPTARSLAWIRLTRNVGVASWAALVLALCGLLSFSFVKNLNTIKKARDEFSVSTKLQGMLLDDVVVMDRFRKAVSRIETYNRQWWFPRFGLTQSRELEVLLKSKYCAQFHEQYAVQLDQQLDRSIKGFIPSSPDVTLGRHALHLARRINLLKAALEQTDLPALGKKVAPSFGLLVPSKDAELVAQVNERLVDQYRHYLVWQGQFDVLREEQVRLQALLNRILTLPGTNLNWLAALVNADSGLPVRTLKDFWGEYVGSSDEAAVPPAFTVQGKELIDAMMAEMESALNDPLNMAAGKAKFKSWYDQAYAQVWFDFGRKFPEAEYYLADKASWQQLAGGMADDKNPYFAVLGAMIVEMKGVQDMANPPSWVRLLAQLERAMLVARGESALAGQASLVSKVAQQGKKVIDTLEHKTGSPEAAQAVAEPFAAGKLYTAYKEALGNISLASSSRQVSFQLAGEIFKDDPATSKSPFYVAQKQLSLLREELRVSGDEQGMVWRLLSGPLQYLRDYVCLEASCQLNALWEKDVLVELQGVNDKTRLNEMLFESNGLALKFLQGPADPFLGRSLKKGFFPKTALGRMLPFHTSYLSFLTEGTRLAKFKPQIQLDEEPPPEQFAPKTASPMVPAPPAAETAPSVPGPLKLRESYLVDINALPITVNKDAKLMPHAASLEMVCGDNSTRLLNLNYPVRKKFNWMPKNCDEVNVQIEIGSMVLRKQYKGQYAFPLFISEFQQGSHTFKPADFPDEQKLLTRQQVKQITVSYQFDNIKPLLEIIAQENERLQALKKAQEVKPKAPESKQPDITEALVAWEEKQKKLQHENEAIRSAWKAKQAQRAEAMKKAWEQQLPEIPGELCSCWDQ
ncbi:MAG: hypothetical protein BWK76_01195 [Desulfobulbaceae bacterium A2]|nr:MAG: hypothetical protein BWK76_01195 [Desulfobulbaceae bacterium A2]